MTIARVVKQNTRQHFLGIQITKDRQTIFRDMPWPDSTKRSIRRVVITGMKGTYLNYVTLEPIAGPYARVVPL
jgi:GTPase Era involved in 16S rRNA processing